MKNTFIPKCRSCGLWAVAVAVFLLFETVMMTPSQTAAADVPSLVETVVAPLTGDGKPIFGCSVAVIHQGNVSFHHFGKVRDKDDQLPTEKTVYEIASVTKLFTGVLLADMVNCGVVTLDTRLVELLPNLESLPEKVKIDLDSITLRDIATHRSGLPRLAPNFWTTEGHIRENPYKIFTVEKVFATLADWENTNNVEKNTNTVTTVMRF